MTDRAAATTLWSIATLGTAAVLATLAPSIAALPLSARFAFGVLVILSLSGLACRFGRHGMKLCSAGPSDAGNSGPLSVFLSVASHEMKTPLAGIKAYVELLADGDADDEATREEFLDGISSQTERLERTIDELLELARLETTLGDLQLAETTRPASAALATIERRR